MVVKVLFYTNVGLCLRLRHIKYLPDFVATCTKIPERVKWYLFFFSSRTVGMLGQRCAHYQGRATRNFTDLMSIMRVQMNELWRLFVIKFQYYSDLIWIEFLFLNYSERCVDKVEHTFGPSFVRRTISFMNNLPDFQFSLNMTGRINNFSVAPWRII